MFGSRVNLCKSGGMEWSSRAIGNRLANELVVGDMIFFRQVSFNIRKRTMFYYSFSNCKFSLISSSTINNYSTQNYTNYITRNGIFLLENGKYIFSISLKIVIRFVSIRYKSFNSYV